MPPKAVEAMTLAELLDQHTKELEAVTAAQGRVDQIRGLIRTRATEQGLASLFIESKPARANGQRKPRVNLSADEVGKALTTLGKKSLTLRELGEEIKRGTGKAPTDQTIRAIAEKAKLIQVTDKAAPKEPGRKGAAPKLFKVLN